MNIYIYFKLIINMTSGKFIKTTIGEYLKESKEYPFNLSVEQKSNNGFRYKIFYYTFNIDSIDYQCVIYPNEWNLRRYIYDVVFIEKGGNTKDRIGKDLNFMNSVLKTVAKCMIDFINKNKIVREIRFQSEGIREKSYIRFFKNHPFFSKYEIDDTYEYSGFVEIKINKN